MELRPYQKKLVEDVKKSVLRGNNSVCAVLGCGGGKSIIQATIAKNATEKHSNVLFLVHRKELCEQIRQTFQKVGVDFDFCDISMVQTASRRIDKLPNYNLIITDEAHHSSANTYKKIYEHYPNTIRLGFTATPIRLNRGGLGEVYKDLVTSVSTKWLIDNGYLAPYKYYSVQLADTSKLHTANGDYKQCEVSELMESNVIYGDTVKQWERLAKGKKTIIYCSSVKSAEETAKEFELHGYKAKALSGKTDKSTREKVMRAFRGNDIDVLTNCELFGEGLDVPDCECVVLLRPTQSLSLFVQQSMRSMRYKEGKTAIIIDHVGNCYRHGLPDDNREWSLEPKAVQEITVKIRECPNCYAVYPPTLSKCPYCGYEAVKEVRTVNRKTVDIDLVEVKRQEEVKNTKLKDADLRTWEEIVDFQKIHGYNFSWCVRYASSHRIDFPSKYAYSARKYQKIHRKSKINIDEL